MQTIETAVLPVPQEGEVFELTLSEVPDPIGMVREDGYGSPNKWKFRGPAIEGKQTKRFKLVRLGYQSNMETANGALAEHGRPALGQWREAFKKKFPRSDGKGPVAFTGSEWVFPCGHPRFTYVGGNRNSWISGFTRTDYDFSGRWRFVVEVPD